MNEEKYADIISARLNSIQNLQASISGFLGSFLILSLANFDKLSPSITGFVIPATFVWGYLFSLYQAFACFKCAEVLGSLESSLKEYKGIRYAGDKRFPRHILHGITHNLPIFIIPIYLTTVYIDKKISAILFFGLFITFLLFASATILVFYNVFFSGSRSKLFNYK